MEWLERAGVSQLESSGQDGGSILQVEHAHAADRATGGVDSWEDEQPLVVELRNVLTRAQVQVAVWQSVHRQWDDRCCTLSDGMGLGGTDRQERFIVGYLEHGTWGRPLLGLGFWGRWLAEEAEVRICRWSIQRLCPVYQWDGPVREGQRDPVRVEFQGASVPSQEQLSQIEMAGHAAHNIRLYGEGVGNPFEVDLEGVREANTGKLSVSGGGPQFEVRRPDDGTGGCGELGGDEGVGEIPAIHEGGSDFPSSGGAGPHVAKRRSLHASVGADVVDSVDRSGEKLC